MVRAKARIKTGYTCAVVPNYLKVKHACKMGGVHIRLGVLTIVGSDVLLLGIIYNQTQWVKQCLMTSSLMIG